jgi:hypothetical protein
LALLSFFGQKTWPVMTYRAAPLNLCPTRRRGEKQFVILRQAAERAYRHTPDLENLRLAAAAQPYACK